MQTLIICKGCSQNKPHQAFGYCNNCYHRLVVRKTASFDSVAVKKKASTKLKEQWAKDERIKSKLSKEQLEQMYGNQKMSMGDIAKVYSCSRVYIMLLLDKYGIPKRSKSEARVEAKKQGKNVNLSLINEDFFKSQTPEMAYVLGFIYSDGCIGNLLDHFSISQKEPEILYKIKALMSSEHTIARRKNQELYTLTIGNRVIIKDLLDIGLTPNKSLDVKFPILDEDVYSHFIRGYFDGDGTISVSNKAWKVGFVSGSKLFLEVLAETFVRYARSSKRPVYSRSDSRAHELVYTRRTDVISIFNFFYDELTLQRGLFLPRKHEKFLQYMTVNGVKIS